MEQIQTWFCFSFFCQHYISWASDRSPLQLGMCSRHSVNRLRQMIKGQIPKYTAVALATTSNLTETARWEYTEKQVFIISRALRAPSWEQDEQLLSREIKKIPRTVAITGKAQRQKIPALQYGMQHNALHIPLCQSHFPSVLGNSLQVLFDLW